MGRGGTTRSPRLGFRVRARVGALWSILREHSGFAEARGAATLGLTVADVAAARALRRLDHNCAHRLFVAGGAWQQVEELLEALNVLRVVDAWRVAREHACQSAIGGQGW
jgi:hypothetical protein